MSQGNEFAYAILVIFPVLASFLFKKLSTPFAVAWTIAVGYLVLPVDTFFDLPALPPLNKQVIPALAAWLLAFLLTKKRVALLPEHGFIRLIYICSFLAIAATCLLNNERLIIGSTVLPAHGFFNTSDLSLLVSQFFLLIPFLLGRQFFSSEKDLNCLLKVLVVAGAFYALLVIWEVRMSPQLHTQLYGYFPHDGGFKQQQRAGGFRSVAFIGHGLGVAVFLTTVFISAIYFYRTKQKVLPASAFFVLAYIGGVILVSKTFAAYAYMLCGLVFFFVLKEKAQRLVFLLLCVTVLAYPLIRSAEVFPDQFAVDSAEKLSADRAQSLAFRFRFEELLLDKAEKKPFFGWGQYARNRIYDLDGNDISVTDGQWLVIFGSKGWFGYLSYYGLLLLPVIMWIKNVKHYGRPPVEVLYLSFILVLVVANTLINSGISPIIWLISGALLGFSERRSKQLSSGVRTVVE